MYSKVYAVAAEDSARLHCASGGAFYLAAVYVLQKGGVVCGARYADDFRAVFHTVIDSEHDLAVLLSSKYVQSDSRDSYTRVGQALSAGKLALFCGTPCQCAGLRSFIEAMEIPDGNLIIADLICHAAPSPKAWQFFVDEKIAAVTKRYAESGEKIVRAVATHVNQRSKRNGWQTNIELELQISLELADGSRITHSEFEEKANERSWWYPWLHRNAAARITCYNCAFACKARQGDITLGDFWGVDDVVPGMNDDKGLSLVLARAKGVDFINKVAQSSGCSIKIFRELNYLEAECALLPQRGMRGGWPLTREREAFFDALEASGFHAAATKLLEVPRPNPAQAPVTESGTYDVGIVGWYYSGNIGDVLTNWATYRFFELQGLRPLMIADPYLPAEKFSERQRTSFDSVKIYYNISDFRPIEKLSELNDSCKKFVVAGGATWSWYLLVKKPDFYDLGFADESSRKVSFVPSLLAANTEEYTAGISAEDKPAIQSFADNFKRFDTVFIRDTTAQNVMEEVFGVTKSIRTYDPVLFIQKEAYAPLIESCTAEIPENPYIFYYLFDMHLPFIVHYHGLANKMGLSEIFLVPSRNQSLEDYCAYREHVKNSGFSTAEATIENWVGLTAKSDYVLCDSFHAAALAIRFAKPFVVLKPRNEDGRFDFLEYLGLDDRIMTENFTDIAKMEEILKKPVDWKSVNAKLDKKCSADAKLLKKIMKIPNKAQSAKTKFKRFLWPMGKLCKHFQRSRSNGDRK
ncbi:MAG: polysaccharide pyruvyl transferase family protein [Clostridium sp.]|nr:polysaccharide pyruvyl transferase family protein [Clostridium sp.]